MMSRRKLNNPQAPICSFQTRILKLGSLQCPTAIDASCPSGQTTGVAPLQLVWVADWLGFFAVFPPRLAISSPFSGSPTRHLWCLPSFGFGACIPRGSLAACFTSWRDVYVGFSAAASSILSSISPCSATLNRWPAMSIALRTWA